MKKIRVSLLVFMIVLLTGLAACDDSTNGEYEYDADSAADCDPGDEYDAEYGVCYGYDEIANNDSVDSGNDLSDANASDSSGDAGDTSGEYEYDADSAADCDPGDEYDAEYSVCYGYDDGNSSDGGFWDNYYETAEDCYDDEVYDPVDQLCYLADDANADYGTVFDDVFDSYGDEGSDYQDLDEFGDDAIITYDVQGNEIVNPQKTAVAANLQAYQNDTNTHQLIWTHFATLIPQEQRTFVSKYSIFSDGPDNVMAAVTQDSNDPNKWVLAVDIADASNQQELTYSLIHEFGHLLTLNDAEVNIDEDLFYQQDNDAMYNEAANACPTYFPGEGCAKSTSYINTFYDQFWSQYEDQVADIEAIQDENEYQDAVYEFYQQHPDEFVTDYAATNPGEDIAESWTAFILQPKPTGHSIADQKVLFFYDYPELVRLRGEITSRTYSRLRVRP